MRSGWMAGMLAGAVLAGVVRGERLTATAGDGWLTVAPGTGGSIGLRITQGARSVVERGRARDLEVTQILLRGGVTPARGIHLWAEAGAARAHLDGRLGATGPAGGAGVTLRPFVLVLRGTDLSPRKEHLALDLDLGLRAAASNRQNARLYWREVRVAPAFAYRMDYGDEPGRRAYQPVETGLRFGPLWRRVDGRHGPASLRENGNFGAAAGVDLRWNSGWATHIDAALLGGGEHEVALGLARHF